MRTQKNIDSELVYSVREIGVEQKDLIFERYLPIIKSIAYQKYKKQAALGVDYEDCIQEGFIGLNRAIDCYDLKSEASFYTYACLCIERQIQNFTRRFYRLKEVKDYKYYEEEDSYQVVADTSTAYVINDFYNQRLIHLKHTLPFTRSCVFELRYNGFSYKEISKLLDIKEKEVDMHLYKLRRFLKTRDLKDIFL